MLRAQFERHGPVPWEVICAMEFEALCQLAIRIGKHAAERLREQRPDAARIG
jgi:hypothetical protein